MSQPARCDQLADVTPPVPGPAPAVQAFEAFYERQYADVYAFVLRRLAGSREDVADVTAEIFATAWRRLDRIPTPPEDRLWIYGVARRVLSRHRRTQWRRSRLLGRLRSEASIDAPSDDPDGRADEHERVRAAIARLRPADHDVLMLVLWERLSHLEAAQILGCSANAVGVRLHRARARLRSALEPGTESEER